ncbi:MAG TPA: PAC2 family protein [Nitrososphaeraceae archaeon]|jgi:uncharacterized protein
MTKTHTDIDESIDGGKTSIRNVARVVQTKKKLRSPILIAGFPGAGLIGSISTSYMINKLNMSQIACVDSEFIVPGVIYAQGKLRHPFRLYSNKEGDVCILVCEAPIIVHGMHSVLDTVMKWALDKNVREVIVMDGIPTDGLPNAKRTPIILSSDGTRADAANLIDDVSAGLENNTAQEDDGYENASYMTTAFIGGMAGGILSSCLSNGIASKALLIPAPRGIPDPEGAAILIEELSKITDSELLKIDTQQLRKQGVSLKSRMKKIMQSYAEQQQGLAQHQEGEKPEKISDGVMYG